MKRNIYSKLWMIFFVLMGAACANQVEDAIPVSGQPIEFSVQSDWKEIPNTRLNDDGTQFVKDDQIQIFGLHKSLSGEVKKFMYDVKNPNYGQIVTYDGNSSWNYTPKRFWPKEGNLEFYASYPYNSIRYDADNHTKIYDQTVNSMKQDLLWGVSTMNDCAAKNNVVITMKHALAKVNISIDNSWGNIGTVMFSAYKAGRFTKTDDSGIPAWEFKDDDKTPFTAVFGYYDLIRDNTTGSTSLTVFILPGNITEFQMFDDHNPGNRIDASTEISNRIKNLTFDAGKEYNLKISSTRVRKKNTNSRSIAMSVRCVSE